MNPWFRQQEKEAQERKIRDLENKVREIELDRDRYKRERDDWKNKHQGKCTDYETVKINAEAMIHFKDEFLRQLDDLTDSIRNY